MRRSAMALFRSKAENALAELRARRAKLAEQLATARSEAEAAMAERRKFLLEDDAADADGRKAVDAAVVAAQSSETGLMDAIEQLDVRIAADEQRIADERA